MAAPPRPSAPSISSSGHRDGLGRRVIVFDRADGTMLEALHVRPEIGALERLLRAQIEEWAAFEDERFARIRGVDRDLETGDLIVVSEFVPGSRLSDLLDVAQDAAQEGITPGVDVALGYLLEALLAISTLHTSARMVHGAIAPARTVLTPAGQVVFLDGPFAPVLEQLRFSSRHLWREFGIAMPDAAGSPRFDKSGDIAQVALSAVMLVLGRPLRDSEYPEGLSPLIAAVSEVAQIRGSAEFAAGVQRFLQNAMPVAGPSQYTSAQAAAADIRDIVSGEMGTATCRRALLEFVADTAGLATNAVRSRLETHEPPTNAAQTIDFDALVAEMLAAIDRAGGESAATATLRSVQSWDDPAALAREILGEEAPESSCEPLTHGPAPENEALVDSVSTTASESAVSEPALPREATPVVEVTEPPSESPRLKRQRSARARKDTLRSIATTLRSSPAGSQAPPQKVSPVLVAGGRTASYDSGEPPVTRTPIGFAPPAPLPVAVPPIASPPATVVHAALVPPTPPTPIPMPKFPAPRGAGTYATAATTTVWSAPPIAAPEPTASPVRPVQLQKPSPVTVTPRPVTSNIRLQRDSAPAPKISRLETRRTEPELFAPAGRIGTAAGDEPRAFPWKLAIAGIVIVAIAIVAGRALMPNHDAAAAGARTEAAGPARGPAKALSRTAATAATATAHLDITTQPAGARVLLDGMAAGETPLKLDVTPGRHVLTFLSSAGSVKRNVRAEAGRTVNLDVPLFSGWIAVLGPVVLDVAENGKSIGSSENGRLMLSSGRHELTLSNQELGYETRQAVDINAGEVKSITVDARGGVDFNAAPWAEVWIDGKKIGETPLANEQVQIGLREIVFKHPQYGERRMTLTVRGDSVGAASVDFNDK